MEGSWSGTSPETLSQGPVFESKPNCSWGQGPAALEGVRSGFQSAQLEPGFLRDTKLLQGILQQGGGGVRENSGSEALYPPTPTLPAGPNIHLACHLLDLTPIEDKAPAHELVAGEEAVSQGPTGS